MPVPPEIDPPQPPPPTLLLREALALRELPRLAWRLRALAREARGEGAPVLVLPGYGASDASTLLLRSYLRLLDYDARGWGLGTNRGDVGALVPQVIERAASLALEVGAPVRLVGWSLGGVLARETARERPELVARVVTLGSPVVGGPKYTAVAGMYRRRGVDLDAVEREIEARERVPIRAPITAIFSRTDGVVAWQACIDRRSPNVEHVEVDTSHVGLGLSPEVYRIVARRLAALAPESSA